MPRPKDFPEKEVEATNAANAFMDVPGTGIGPEKSGKKKKKKVKKKKKTKKKSSKDGAESSAEDEDTSKPPYFD